MSSRCILSPTILAMSNHFKDKHDVLDYWICHCHGIKEYALVCDSLHITCSTTLTWEPYYSYTGAFPVPHRIYYAVAFSFALHADMQIVAVALCGMLDRLTFRRSIHATGYHIHPGKWEGRDIHGKIGYRIECTTQQAAMTREVVSSTVDMNPELHVCTVIWSFQ